MQGVLTGFSTVWIVIIVGYLAAKAGAVQPSAQKSLADVSFNLGSPALLFLLLYRVNLQQALAPHLLVSVAAMVLTGALYVLTHVLWWKRSVGDAVIGTFASCYTNAANLGLPIAAYVLGDMAWMAPILLIQTIAVQPLGLAILDVQRAKAQGRRASWAHNLVVPFTNPMTVGALSGLALHLARVPLPQAVVLPLELLGQLSIPTLLVAFGISLTLGQGVGRGPHAAQAWCIAGLKLLVMPLIAFTLARLVGLDAHTTLAVTVMAGLPSAQNIFIHAVRYDQSIPLARDTIFIDTLGSIPTLMALSLLLAG